jgi:DNA-binding response OmpR family regulator
MFTPFDFGDLFQMFVPEIRVEEYLDEDRFTVRAEIPGMDPEKDVEVTVVDGMLKIGVERAAEKHEKMSGMGQPSGQRRVLVVDDERSFARLVASYLERAGYAVECVFDGAAALEAARRAEPDVVVLDLMLPEVDGLEVCRRLRTFSDCYVLMLTARAEEVDRLIGLEIGADDYVTKPFSPRELVARVRAMLRRPRVPVRAPVEEPPRRFGPLEIDTAGREVRLNGRLIELTRIEFDVLAALSARPKVAFSRAQLIEAVWGDSWVGDEHLVDVHVAHLRRKLADDPGAPRFIRTVRGIGYRMGDGS